VSWGYTVDDLWPILLGAGLALVGGIVSQHYQERLKRTSSEQQTLLDVNQALLDLSGLLNSIGYRDVLGDPNEYTLPECRLELLEILSRLQGGAVRLTSKKHRSLAVRLSKLALDAPLRTKENVYAVTREVQLRLNRKMIERYELDMSDSPTDF